MAEDETTVAAAGTQARRIDLDALVKDLRGQVSALETDLRARASEVDEFATALRAEYDEAFAAERTAATYESWLDDRVTQVAAAWVLGTVFVRFCEDNALIPEPFLAGPGERLAEAEERHEAYFRTRPQDNDRDWIVAAFDTLADAHPTAKGLFDRRHNPLWEITPSFEAASELIRFWRRRGEDGAVRHDFTDGDLDTRFLGDLYQDLSENARKTYALLQTPEFVEEFILDLTLTPAIDEFGIKDLRTIDPACGSGHFLLGLFHRILAKWRAEAPGTDEWERIRRSAESVHGCDKNPFAASIARFRLLVAVLHAAGERKLERAREFPINVAVGDSLLHGRGVGGEQGDLFKEEPYTYATEDINEYVRSCDLLGRGTYHVVVGNPPYITVKDKRENQNYRNRYDACAGTYALSVPFAQRLFELAIRKNGSERDAGFVGQITANSFMKRGFGKNLVEAFFPAVSLTHVIDTSGAYIPGHGTPTVILAGRNAFSRVDDAVVILRGVQGEPSQPDDPASGIVWSAIIDQLNIVPSESKWISADRDNQVSLASHPWSLSGGGTAELRILIEKQEKQLGHVIDKPIGRAIRAGADEAFVRPRAITVNKSSDTRNMRPIVRGEDVRDWRLRELDVAWYPYSEAFSVEETLTGELWPLKTALASRRTFQGVMEDAGREWWEYMQHTASAYYTPLSITLANVATHLHAVLDRGGKVFDAHAPVIKLPKGAGEDEHLALLGVLNSSTACFWLKQVSQPKGGSGLGRGVQDEEWEERYEFTGTKLQEFPLPADLPLDLGRALDSLAQELSAQEPSTVAAEGSPTRDRLNAARAEHERTRARMIALQEELDWDVYHSYGLLSDKEVPSLTAANHDDVPEIALGERAFEIVLARKVATGETTTVWFDRHGATPITEVPSYWPEWYQEIVQNRIDVIEKRRDIALIERPECKRRWSSEPWEKKEAEALRTWLLDRCERRDVWFGMRDGFDQPRTRTVNQLADAFRSDGDMHAVARLYATDHLGKPDMTLAQVLERVVADQHVPYLAALRYKDSGLRKRAQWEQVWDLQREEDRTGQRLDIPVPPKYKSADFRKGSYWSQRGKLDVPKERFVSYPGAAPGVDSSLLLGWAGWDHKDQAQALVNIVNDRGEGEGWATEALTPLLAGLAEVLPWVRQWHGEHDEEWGGVPADEYEAFLTEQRGRHRLTEEDLMSWRPATGRRGGAKGEQQ